MLSDKFTTFVQELRNKLVIPANAKDQMLTRDAGVFTATPVSRPVGFVETDAELTTQKGQEESFQDIFDSWLRISRSDGYSDESVPAELDAWEYDSGNDQVVCTQNTSSMVGFISPKQFDEYILEATLNSSSSDDDFIGLCIAYATDDSGDTHTLTVFRALNGDAPMRVLKDYSTEFEYSVAEVFSGLEWSGGRVASGSLGGTNDQGWDLMPNGCLLKVTREGDIVTIETSQMNETSYYDPATTVIDLSADPELDVFRGAHPFGYICRSQPQSTWTVHQRPGARAPIVDLRNYDLHTFQDGAWVQEASTPADLVTRGVLTGNWMHHNPTTDRFYFMDDQNTVTRI